MANDEMITSAVRRFVKLGGLAGRVGASVVGNQVLDVARSGPAKQIKKPKTWFATRFESPRPLVK